MRARPLLFLKELPNVIRVWFAIGLTGLVLVFLLPPFQAHDEHTHFYRAVNLSRGNLYGQKLADRAGDYLPARYQQTVDSFSYMFLRPEEKTSLSMIVGVIAHPKDSSQLIETNFENTVTYPPIAYFPQSLAIAVVGKLTSNVLIQLYAARLAALATYLALLFFAIKKLPFGREVLCAIALLPISLVLSASSAGDAISFALIASLIAYCLALSTKSERLQPRDYIFLVLLLACVSLLKAPYSLFSLVALALPMKLFPSNTQGLWTKGLFLSLSVALVVGWQQLSSSAFINVFPGSSTSLQITRLGHEPLKFFVALWRALSENEVGKQIIEEVVGLKSWYYIPTPWPVIVFGYFLVILATNGDATDTGKRTSFWITAVSLAVAFIVTFLVPLLLYITYAPVGSDVVIGLQGRYFIPILAVSLIGSSSFFIKRRWSIFTGFWGWVAVLVMCGYTYMAILTRFYK